MLTMRQPSATASSSANANRRAYWLRQLRQWHWISAAVCLLGTLMFAVTGITLNHASHIEAEPIVKLRELSLPSSLRDDIAGGAGVSGRTLPAPLTEWLGREFGVEVRHGEWSDEEIYVSLPRPGGDAWISIDRETGAVQYEVTDRGWISYLNDLHKGRNTGPAWSLFIDVFAIACVVFSLTGLALLQLYAANRPMTWPLVGLGCVLPLLIAFFLIH